MTASGIAWLSHCSQRVVAVKSVRILKPLMPEVESSERHWGRAAAWFTVSPNPLASGYTGDGNDCLFDTFWTYVLQFWRG
jgi:hypothetical protein